jgi:radical SAM-linked protein
MAFSEGFNPHMKLKLSAPLPLGIGSEAEYFSAECKGITAEEFLRLYNEYRVEGLKGLNAWETDKNPNFQGIVTAADYILPIKLNQEAVSEILNSKSYTINYTARGKEDSLDGRPLIYNLESDGDKLIARLALGNTNLRADRLLYHLNSVYGTDGSVSDIVRIAQYGGEGKFINFDTILEGMKV